MMNWSTSGHPYFIDLEKKKEKDRNHLKIIILTALKEGCALSPVFGPTTKPKIKNKLTTFSLNC